MPPQQPERLLDLIDEALSFRAHEISIAARAARSMPDGDLPSPAGPRNSPGGGVQ
jgi:hypothetical protein